MKLRGRVPVLHEYLTIAHLVLVGKNNEGTCNYRTYLVTRLITKINGTASPRGSVTVLQQ